MMSTTATLTPEAKTAIDACYSRYGLNSEATVQEKIAKLNIELGNGVGLFFAYGGEETDDMELKAMEFMYLLEEGYSTPIQA